VLELLLHQQDAEFPWRLSIAGPVCLSHKQDYLMATRRILATWIGHNDLLGLAFDLDGERQKSVLDSIKRTLPAEKGSGPIKTLVDQERFDEIHLLSNGIKKSITRPFIEWLGAPCRLHEVDVENPTDYSAIFAAADAVLAEITRGSSNAAPELCIHLSPGTPAMTAIWVLLGKSRYPATFFQSYKGQAWKTDIPFDLVVDFVPEVLQRPDSNLQHLAARSPQDVAGFESIIGQSQAIRLAVGRAQKAAVRDVPVLVLGETGTGKEMFARAIHAASHRKDGPFVAINCAAMPKDLLESELFGHAKGAFTGADKPRVGAFETADGGTLFLDEFGECGPEMQAKLLRALQPPPGKGPCHRIFQRVGETIERASNVRIVAATNRDLLQDIRQNQFREDLYYRLAVISLKLPPLRERRTDIPLLAQSLLDQINREFALTEPGYEPRKLTRNALAYVKRHPWRGNVRQLHNALVQAAVMCDGAEIKPADLASATADQQGGGRPDETGVAIGDGFSIEKHLEDIQRHYLTLAMDEANGVLAKAFKLLGLSTYQTLDNQLKRLKVDRSRWKRS
jgi:DNA-binding NtrC family response regulator